MGLLGAIGDAAEWTWDHKMQVGAAALGAGAIVASGGTAAPLVLGAAAAGGALGAGKELYEKYGDDNPNNDKWNWGSVASGTAYGAGAGALAATPSIAAARAGTTAVEGATAAETAPGASRVLNPKQFASKWGNRAKDAWLIKENAETRQDIQNIDANTATSWQQDAGFDPVYGAANPYGSGFVT